MTMQLLALTLLTLSGSGLSACHGGSKHKGHRNEKGERRHGEKHRRSALQDRLSHIEARLNALEAGVPFEEVIQEAAPEAVENETE